QSGITHTQLFNGAASAGAIAALTTPLGAFGFYLEFQGTYFYSDSNLNAGKKDQLVSYRGPSGGLGTVGGQLWDENSYLLAWEDLPYDSSDKDYNDMVLMIRVQNHNVPDSGTTAVMVISGLAALIGLRRKLR
ncbi:MAG TPA: VPDSG-CTERM sorting domain-containing protein, partial [Lacunisphaera sp.]|nr:VPDSG-CTERM sorting domain-containing protein [Lacunisphaera sp.]